MVGWERAGGWGLGAGGWVGGETWSWGGRRWATAGIGVATPHDWWHDVATPGRHREHMTAVNL